MKIKVIGNTCMIKAAAIMPIEAQNRLPALLKVQALNSVHQKLNNANPLAIGSLIAL